MDVHLRYSPDPIITMDLNEKVSHYERTPRQDMAIGLQVSEETRKQLEAEGSDGKEVKEELDLPDFLLLSSFARYISIHDTTELAKARIPRAPAALVPSA